MSWIDLSGAFGYGTKLTSQQQQQLRDNITALAEGASGAPSIEEAAMGAASVNQAALKTSSGSVSRENTSWGNPTLPGGQYGFYPQVRTSGGGVVYAQLVGASGYSGTNYTTIIGIKNGIAQETAYAQQRYVTASGEVFWIFMLRDKATKNIISVWQAPDHPCFGNGGDSELMPHPFLDFDSGTEEIIVINPAHNLVQQLREKTINNKTGLPGRDLIEVITGDCVIDESKAYPWPQEVVTVGLPDIWQELPMGAMIAPIKREIIKPAYLKAVGIKLK